MNKDRRIYSYSDHSDNDNPQPPSKDEQCYHDREFGNCPGVQFHGRKWTRNHFLPPSQESSILDELQRRTIELSSLPHEHLGSLSEKLKKRMGHPPVHQVALPFAFTRCAD